MKNSKDTNPNLRVCKLYAEVFSILDNEDHVQSRDNEVIIANSFVFFKTNIENWKLENSISDGMIF